MRQLQALSWFAFTAFLGAVILGFRLFERSLFEIDLRYYMFAVFLVMLRFKLALDDHFYFGVTRLRRLQSQLGLMFAGASWFLFIFSAYNLRTLGEAYLLCIFSIGISTVWIVVVAIREGFYREQIIWLITNAVYLMLIALLLWIEKTPRFPAAATVDAVLAFAYTPEIVIGVLIATAVVDIGLSKSFENAGE